MGAPTATPNESNLMESVEALQDTERKNTATITKLVEIVKLQGKVIQSFAVGGDSPTQREIDEANELRVRLRELE